MTDKRPHRYSGIGVYGVYKAEEADALFESLEAKISQLEQQISAAEARTHAVEGELEKWQRKSFLYEAAFEDVMYQEYSSNANSIAQFLESAEREADDRMKARQDSAAEGGRG